MNLALFIVAVAVTLTASALLVTRIERIGARLGVTEAVLGLVAALAANAPETTSALAALARGQHDIGVGVVLGSNVFNLAALLGLGGLVAGRIDLHRRVILLAGGVAMWVGASSVLAVTSTTAPVVALVVALAVFVPYVVIIARPGVVVRWGASERTASWVALAVHEEEAEIHDAIAAPRGGWRDVVVGVGSLVVVVLTSIVMEHTGARLGASLGWSNIVIGAVVLAGVTSLPNAVAAVYLALRGRGSAVLSEAMNSNNLNVLIGFLVPAVFVGVHLSGDAVLRVCLFYVALTAGALLVAFARRGIGRLSGLAIILAYGAFVVTIAH